MRERRASENERAPHSASFFYFHSKIFTQASSRDDGKRLLGSGQEMGNKVRVIRLPEPCRHRVVRNQSSDSALCTSSLHSVTDPVRVRPPAADELEGSIRDPDVTRPDVTAAALKGQSAGPEAKWENNWKNNKTHLILEVCCQQKTPYPPLSLFHKHEQQQSGAAPRAARLLLRRLHAARAAFGSFGGASRSGRLHQSLDPFKEKH